MSIYATWLSLDDVHEGGCNVYQEVPPGSGIFEWSGKPCDCELPNQPIAYQGSHVLPSEKDRRAGYVYFCAIPDHIEHDGKAGPHDFARLSLRGDTPDDPVVVLTRSHVQQLRDTLTSWLEGKERE